MSIASYFACPGCDWEGTWDEVKKSEDGECCPECGDDVEYDETEEFSECGFLCLACGNTDESLFDGAQCLNCITNKI